MLIHPKIASGRCGVEVGMSPKTPHSPSPFKYFGLMSSHFHIRCFSWKCIYVLMEEAGSPYDFSFIRILEMLADVQPTNRTRHVRLLCHKLERKCFMEIEPQQLSKWDFFSPPFPSFSLSCFRLTALPGHYNLNVLWFASPASCLGLTVMAGFLARTILAALIPPLASHWTFFFFFFA